MKVTTFICLAIVASALAGPWAAADNPKLSSQTNKRLQQERVRKDVQERKDVQQPLHQVGEEIREEKPDVQQR